MNYHSLSLFVLLLFIAGCGKSVPAPTNKYDAPATSLLGKWTFSEYYFSIGGPGSWKQVQPSGQTIEFKSDGAFQSTASFSNTFNRYEISDSARIKFTPAPTASGYVLMEFEIDAAGRTLLLTPVEPMCIEGCSDKFTR